MSVWRFAERIAPVPAGARITLGEGNTPLHMAVIRRNVDLAKMLLKNGADANARNGDGRTPLHLAVDQAEMAALLLTHGADPRWRTDLRVPQTSSVSLSPRGVAPATARSARARMGRIPSGGAAAER